MAAKKRARKPVRRVRTRPDLHVHLPGIDLVPILAALTKLEKRMAKELDDLTREVSETNSVMQSAVALIQGLKQKLDEAGTDPAKLKALSESLDTGANALAQAVAANTPAQEGGEQPGTVEPV